MSLILSNINGQYGFIALALLVLLFLIRPRPKEKVIPSLMFLMRRKKKSKLANLFRRLIKDPLKLIQLIIVLMLIFSLYQPLYTYIHDSSSDNVVMIIDASGSVKKFFDKIKDSAIENLDSRTSIILMTDRASLLGEGLSKGSAKKIINSLNATDLGSNLMSSLIFADEMINGTGTIKIISDFSVNESVKNIVPQILKNNKVIPIYVRPNDTYSVTINGYEDNNLIIRNFGDKKVNLEVIVDGKAAGKDSIITIEDNDRAYVPLNLSKGIHKIELKAAKEIYGNSEYYLNIPSSGKLRILVISNDYGGPLRRYLDSTDFQVDVVQPPVIPSINNDLVILYKIKEPMLISGIMDAIDDYLSKGGNLIIYADENLGDSKIQKYLPFYLREIKSEKKTLTAESPFLDESLIFTINRYFNTMDSDKKYISISKTDDNATVLSLSHYKHGTVLYFGVFDDYSILKNTVDYPLFFERAIKYMSKYEEFSYVNKLAGNLIKSENNTFTALNAGLYDVDGFKIAVNQNDEYYDNPFIPVHKNGNFDVEKKFNVNYLVISIALLMMLFEVYYIKRRGDI